eukprot:CAMPEP_0185689648 /NCGR_PEP_ID=MMETSP1164-20130828/593_1 /TAXON_ID=1104430 /ORGANISM="Chrysoreinhardia sp, Strain CCMP2950" /LENGTH=95 /DNA_ID=CAMNT_0028356153 /DNA_START=10 /DNA_END=297 /DNA_ORIENTATION=+
MVRRVVIALLVAVAAAFQAPHLPVRSAAGVRVASTPSEVEVTIEKTLEAAQERLRAKFKAATAEFEANQAKAKDNVIALRLDKIEEMLSEIKDKM